MEEFSIFDFVKTPLKIDKPIRLIELFAGIGAQAKALERLGVDFEHYKISEWEVNATASYKAIHKEHDNTDYSEPYSNEELTEILFNIGISTDGKKPMSLKEIARKGEPWKRTVYNNFKATNNIGSILNVKGADLGIIDTDKYCYILTYSFPCQDLSLAGKGKGMAKDSGTRSGLLWEVERLLNECSELPQILLMENVTQVHGSKNREHFDEWIRFLESKGYSNFWQDLNAKNFGVPQNRNRTFMVSVLGDYIYKFPQEFPLELRLKDMLEDSVDEKFYISNSKIDKIVNSTFAQEKAMIQKTDVCGTLLSRDYKDPKCVEVGNLTGGKWDKMHDVSRRVYSEDGIAPTIHTCGGGNTEPKVIAGIGEKKSNGGTQWYQQDRIYNDKVAISVTTAFNPYYAVAMRGRLNENGEYEQNVELSDREVANAVTTVQKDSLVAQEPAINVVGNYSPSNHDASRIVDTNGISPTVKENHGTVTGIVEPLAYDDQNQYIRTDGTVGTLTTDGSSPKHNNRVVEPLIWDGYNQRIRAERGTVGTITTNCGADLKRNGQGVIENCYVSEKGVRFICSPKRGMTTDVNADVCQPLTAKGQQNWTGSFISPDIEWLEKSSTIGGTEPTKINLKNGSQITSNDNLSGIRIRKLTPKECWRLMGFDDADFEKAAEVNSNSQLYKQAGNSIVVDVLYYIFREMF